MKTIRFTHELFLLFRIIKLCLLNQLRSARALANWANKVWKFGSGLGSEVSLADFRKDIILELYNEAGQLVMAFKVYRCWPSEYVALEELDANDTCVAQESITIEHEGWERDTSVTEPEEPSVK